MITYISLVTAIALASIAAFFSVLGLSSIFPGAYWSVVVMASSLEVCKLVTATWLHLKWDELNSLIKYYLTFAVIILMVITSMGVFGFLSKAHLEQKGESIEIDLNVSSIQDKINTEEQRLSSIDKQLDLLDGALDEYIQRGYVTKGLSGREEQKPERQVLETAKKEIIAIVGEYKTQLFELEKNSQNREVELGAIKYIAELIYGDQATDYYDAAVRYIILLLVVVFDPMAVLLLIVSSKYISEESKRRQRRSPFGGKKNIMVMNG